MRIIRTTGGEKIFVDSGKDPVATPEQKEKIRQGYREAEEAREAESRRWQEEKDKTLKSQSIELLGYEKLLIIIAIVGSLIIIGLGIVGIIK